MSVDRPTRKKGKKARRFGRKTPSQQRYNFSMRWVTNKKCSIAKQLRKEEKKRIKIERRKLRATVNGGDFLYRIEGYPESHHVS